MVKISQKWLKTVIIHKFQFALTLSIFLIRKKTYNTKLFLKNNIWYVLNKNKR